MKADPLSQPSVPEVNSFVSAARGGNLDAVAEFLDKYPAAVNKKNDMGLTALTQAAMWGEGRMVEFLIERGADLEISDSYGCTALMRAASEGKPMITELLIGYGAEVNTKDNEGLTPLMSAASNGYKNIVDMLLKSGATLNAKNNEGKTALDLARECVATEETIALIEELEADIADFSPGLKRAIPAARPFNFPRSGPKT